MVISQDIFSYPRDMLRPLFLFFQKTHRCELAYQDGQGNRARKLHKPPSDMIREPTGLEGASIDRSNHAAIHFVDAGRQHLRIDKVANIADQVL